MELTPRSDIAIDFLQKWNSSGPWVLTAISPENGNILTTAFLDIEKVSKWLTEYNGKWNIYFTINPIKQESVSKKPGRKDITQIIALQCDCDPRMGEDILKERIRILKQLQEFRPHPSIIIDSGGGYQAFFLLEEPIPLDGTEETAIQAEAYSVQLELLLSGDRCSNADRIFRLPGTINLPNEVKLRKGRKAALSDIVEATWERHPIKLFTRAAIKIQESFLGGKKNDEYLPLAGGAEKISIGSVQPLFVDDLERKGINIPDNIKVLIIYGTDPDEPTKYPSRSEALWAVCCALVRAEADDETIAGIILNKQNKISSSVLDKPRPQKYAAKQIADAREEVEDPILREFNCKHAVIGDIGGKCRIISETFDYALNRPRISYQAFGDFKNRYCNKKVQVAVDKDGNAKYRAAGEWWCEHPKRQQYDTIVFAPGRDIPQAYNLWQGFACEAIPGECGLYLGHILQNICKGNEEYYNYILNWMARAVQKPDCPGEVAIVLRGEMGTGKGKFAKLFGSLFGRHFLHISDSKHLVGSFNAHLRDCVVLFGDEAFWAGDKKHEGVLRALITEEQLSIEQKGIDVTAFANFVHLILASNASWVVPAGTNERRYFVLDVSEEKMQNKKYFSAIDEQMREGGREALLYLLINRDISSFEVRDVPKTIALQDQKLLSMSAEETWWYEKLAEGRLLREHDFWENEVMTEELQNDYIGFMQRLGILRKFSPTALGKFLHQVCPKESIRSYQRMAKVKMVGNFGEQYSEMKRRYFYELPKLELCREHWDTYHGGPFKWNEPLRREEQKELPIVKDVLE